MRRLSRRSFAGFTLRLAALWATGARAASVGDRGLGGTGAVPADPTETIGQDRGIGGTGVVGTIRRFGSIVVNDLRVAYPSDVRVVIDGRAATAADLRIGQVVRVLARRRRDGLATRTIVVTNEVVGPVDAVDEVGLTVLGQTILADEALPDGLRPGEVVAVSGLRRLDGTIVASLVTRMAAETSSRLAGPVMLGADGEPQIGDLAIVGLEPTFAGRRVVLAGNRIGDAFRAEAVAAEPAVPFARADRVSIEDYLVRSGDTLRLGSGITIAAAGVGAALDRDEVVRAVVTATPDGRGGLSAIAIAVERVPRDGRRGRSRPATGHLGRSRSHEGPASGPASPGSGGLSRGGTAPGRGGGGGGHGSGGGGL